MTDVSVGERDLLKCFGRHKQQSVQYALKHCLQCRKLKSCVHKSWGTDRQRRWRKDEWWEAKPVDGPRPATGRRPPWPSQPPATG